MLPAIIRTVGDSYLAAVVIGLLVAVAVGETSATRDVLVECVVLQGPGDIDGLRVGRVTVGIAV